MPPSHTMNFIIWGILSEARSRYQFRLCHFLVMANHIHLLVVVDNPQHVSDFMRYVKSEIAHAVNHSLGRRKRTVWEEGYDSPILLTPTKVLEYIKYIYLNPSRAALVDSITEYPGVSSWTMFSTKKHESRHARVPRPLLTPLSSPALSINEQRRIVSQWESMELKKSTFILEPWAWTECFTGIDIEKTEALLLKEIREAEEAYREERRREKKWVIGPTTLRRQSMNKEHTPKAGGRRMICLCEDKELRKRFIEHFRSLCDLARAAYESWKRGDLQLRIPPGLFAPKLPPLASALPF